MKKLLSIVLLVVLVISLATTVRAETAPKTTEELYNYIAQDFTIAGKKVQLLSAENLQIAKNYLYSQDFYEGAIRVAHGRLNNIIAKMDEKGVTNVFDLDEEDFDYVKEQARFIATALELDVDYDPVTGNVSVKHGDEVLASVSAKAVADVESNVAVPVASTDLVQTDVVNYSYLVVPAIAMIAVAMFVAYKKLEENV